MESIHPQHAAHNCQMEPEQTGTDSSISSYGLGWQDFGLVVVFFFLLFFLTLMHPYNLHENRIH